MSVGGVKNPQRVHRPHSLLLHEQRVDFRFDDIDELAIGALAVNYRVGPAELDVLGVYDVAARQQIIRARPE